MVSAHAVLLSVQWASLDTQVVLDIHYPFEQFHSVVIKFVGDVFDLGTLVLESGILSLLLALRFIN